MGAARDGRPAAGRGQTEPENRDGCTHDDDPDGAGRPRLDRSAGLSDPLAAAARQIGEFLAAVEPFFWRKPITYVDVGAHKGDVFRELVRSGLKVGAAHLIEPNPASFAALQQAVQELGIDRAVCHQLALGDRPGRLRLRDADDMTQVIDADGALPPRTFEVEATTLDTLAETVALRRISLLKVDVEGYEAAVLEGARGLLADQAVDMVYIEAGMNPEGTQQTYFRVIEDVLNAHGYRLFRVFEQKNEWPEDSPLLRRVNAAFMSPRFGAANPYGLSANLLRFGRENEKLRQALAERQAAEKARDEQHAAALEAERQRIGELAARLEAAAGAAAAAGRERDAERQRAGEFEASLAALTRESRKLAAARAAGETELGKLRKELARTLASTSWRVTVPLRATGDAVKRARVPRLAAPAALRALGEIESVARARRWLERARAERLVRRSQLFDPAWYLAEYPDVASSGLDPLRHFLSRGRREGRNPSAAFDTADYMKRYPDVARAGMNPLVHYLRRGRREGREIRPAAPRPHPADFDPEAAAAWAAELRAHPAHGDGPLVSVVLPTRDRIRFVPAAIESVLTQSYARWELIVVDDGSTDGTAEAVRTRFKDPRIRVIGTPGLGVSGARNAGLAAASGELVAYLDSDNAWMPEYLELMVAEFARSGAACVYAVLKVRAENGGEPWYRAVPFDYARLRFSNYIDLNIFMHRREMFAKHGGFDVGLRRAVDWDLILRYTRDDPVSFAYFLGAEYDHSDRSDRLTVRELYAFKNVVRNKHWIDWEAEAAKARDPGLVSVVMCVQGPLERSEERLDALFTHPAGCPFELVLVDNGCDAVSKAILSDWRRREPAIRLVEAGENVQRALGSNLGLAAATGATVVFLGEDIEVSPEWLRPLVRPLEDPAVHGGPAEDWSPTARIDGVGLVFAAASTASPTRFMPGCPATSSRPAGRRRSPRSAAPAPPSAPPTWSRLRGFHPIYSGRGRGRRPLPAPRRRRPGLPLRARRGGARHPPAARIRGPRIETDRRQFRETLGTGAGGRRATPRPRRAAGAGSLLPDRPAGPRRAWRSGARAGPGAAPRARPLPRTRRWPGRTLALKIGCPRPEMKDNWGDYHFAVALAAALLRKGVRARIDFAADPDRHAEASDINLVLRGRQRFEPKPGTVNLIWLISHPDRPSADELRGFDHVFVASRGLGPAAREIAARSALPDPAAMHRQRPLPPEPPSPSLPARRSSWPTRATCCAPWCARRSSRTCRSTSTASCGRAWRPRNGFRAPKIDNVDLPRHYASAEVVLNDHWDSMRESGFVSNRIFDALACGAPLVTDRIAGLPEEIAAACHFFGDGVPLNRGGRGRPPRAARNRRRPGAGVAERVRRDHSFDARAEVISR